MASQEKQIEALGIRLEKVMEENAMLRQQLEESRSGLESWKKSENDERIEQEEPRELEVVNNRNHVLRDH